MTRSDATFPVENKVFSISVPRHICLNYAAPSVYDQFYYNQRSEKSQYSTIISQYFSLSNYTIMFKISASQQ